MKKSVCWRDLDLEKCVTKAQEKRVERARAKYAAQVGAVLRKVLKSRERKDILPERRVPLAGSSEQLYLTSEGLMKSWWRSDGASGIEDEYAAEIEDGEIERAIERFCVDLDQVQDLKKILKSAA